MYKTMYYSQIYDYFFRLYSNTLDILQCMLYKDRSLFILFTVVSLMPEILLDILEMFNKSLLTVVKTLSNQKRQNVGIREKC